MTELIIIGVPVLFALIVAVGVLGISTGPAELEAPLVAEAPAVEPIAAPVPLGAMTLHARAAAGGSDDTDGLVHAVEARLRREFAAAALFVQNPSPEALRAN